MESLRLTQQKITGLIWHEVRDGNGEIAKNGGQITKEYARCKGIDVDSISKKAKKWQFHCKKMQKAFYQHTCFCTSRLGFQYTQKSITNM